jgi:hypothetical protein
MDRVCLESDRKEGLRFKSGMGRLMEIYTFLGSPNIIKDVVEIKRVDKEISRREAVDYETAQFLDQV